MVARETLTRVAGDGHNYLEEITIDKDNCEMSIPSRYSPPAVTHFVGSRGADLDLPTGSRTHPWLHAAIPSGDSGAGNFGVVCSLCIQIQITALDQASLANSLDCCRRSQVEPIGVPAIFPRVEDSLLDC